MAQAEQPHIVGGIVDRLEEVSQRDSLHVSDLVTAFGDRSFLPVLMVPALLVVSPLSGIPLFSSACGTAIAFISAQMVVGRTHLWLPDILMRQALDGRRARSAVGKLHGAANWLDRHARDRLRPLMHWSGRKVLQVVCLLCGMSMPFLEFVPFSSSIVGGAVVLFSTALLLRDGLLALFGLLILSGAGAILVTAVRSF